jgi:hypothetical protein
MKKKKDKSWKKEWENMPEFKNQNDIDEFAKLIKQKITKAPSLWHPQWKKRRYANKRYIDES